MHFRARKGLGAMQKVGGAAMFTRSRHFFLGIIVGRMLVTGVWLVIDFLTGTVGNSIFWV